MTSSLGITKNAWQSVFCLNLFLNLIQVAGCGSLTLIKKDTGVYQQTYELSQRGNIDFLIKFSKVQ